jgi:hypothetical protein
MGGYVNVKSKLGHGTTFTIDQTTIANVESKDHHDESSDGSIEMMIDNNERQ